MRATQFFEFVAAIAAAATVDGTARVPSAMMQPIASDDVSATMAEMALVAPVNGIVELAGPEPIPMDELVRKFLASQGDSREVVTDESSGYFGTRVEDHSLTPGAIPRLGQMRFADWLGHVKAAK